MVHRGALGEDRRDVLADHSLVVGVVAVHQVAVDVVEVGDDHEGVVALVHVRVGTNRVATDFGDAGGQRRETRFDGGALLGAGLGLPPQHHDVPEHMSYNSAASAPPSTGVAVPVT